MEPEVPDVGEQVAASIAAGVADRAQDEMRWAIRRRIPRFLWPLIPGEEGSVQEELAYEAKRRFRWWLSSLLTSCFLFVVIGGILFGITAFVVVSIAWQIATL